MSGHTVRTEVTRGKYLKKSTLESEIEAVVTVNSHTLDNPSDYFTFAWTFYRQNGTAVEGTTFLGFGPKAVAGRNLSGYDKTKRPTFQMECKPLSEYQLLTDENDQPIVDENDEYVIGQLEE